MAAVTVDDTLVLPRIPRPDPAASLPRPVNSMSAGPATALGDRRSGSSQIASSAVVVGSARFGEQSLLAEGAVIRSHGAGVEVGTGSAVLENSVVVGNDVIPTDDRATNRVRPSLLGDRRDSRATSARSGTPRC